MQLTYITPEFPRDLEEHYEALRFLNSFLPPDITGGRVFDTRQFIVNYAGFVTLVYSGKVPIGYFILYPVQGASKRSVEIHGVYRQDLKILLGRRAAKALMDHIFSEILNTIFMVARKEKVVAKITPMARTARVWARKYGFEKVPNIERGKTIWKLKRDKYLGIVRI